MRTIGLDLAISGTHKAVIADEQAHFISPVIRLSTDPDDLDRLVRRAREGAEPDEPLRVVMEPTGSMWRPVASYFIQRGVTVHLVKTQQVADLRKYYSKHSGSDRISAEVLVRLPWVDPESLRPLHLIGADFLTGQRWCRQQKELTDLITAVKNRIQAWERAFWPGLEAVVDDLWAPWMRRWREEWYDPWQLRDADTARLTAFLIEAGADPEDAGHLAAGLQDVARRAVGLFGTPQGKHSPYVDYVTLQEQVLRELRVMALYEEEQEAVEQKKYELYRQLYPERHLESLRGVGVGGAAVYFFFIADVSRFARQKQFRGWHGVVPKSDQSGDAEKKGLGVTKAGPALVKYYAYVNADVARQWDPQIAKIYYDQMVNKGKHHSQALCCCATHLLDRVRAILRDDRPYELRDVDGSPVTWEEARAIVLERYKVPEEVRERTRTRARKARRERRAERKRRQRLSR